MSNSCDSCPSKGSCNSSGQCSKVFPKYGKIKNIIGVISGKGGVGKSTVTGILAIELRKQGYTVGVLDADITGPSMPRIFGINEKRAVMTQVSEKEAKFIPVQTKMGIKVMSLNLLMEKEDDPVIWRGPLITGVLNQMYSDSEWGELDYLLIDMPPGTGDVALTVMQTVPLTGMVIVSTPQDMVSMIVKKVVTMTEKMNTPVLGAVENMSYVLCEKCGEKIRVFSKKTASEQVEYLGIPLLAEMPINIDLVENMEKGEIETYITNSNKYEKLSEEFLNQMNK
ncbi:antiporter inner membrane protein [Clostridium tepidiprofundi DSM 19306]|uniref:Iron-sulfur cluster carrier protein n=1 Tax=Clostridium tepidiprofundi DSM 19306 TaxID=1121338 RepID=A0A151B2Y7_9CLOT|nr:Mrp/NBP35 family ATP-binding protein [Clostridium tepidiprofundi]KYH34143.1 antiporter inner membrane protein [Clostridium tepidiprofundi DSM 19306]